MFVELDLFVVGLAFLVFGAVRAVTSAGVLALHYGVSPFFIGVTLISVGTSIPEMVTSVYAAYYGAGDLVAGNIVGSETAQITLATIRTEALLRHDDAADSTTKLNSGVEWVSPDVIDDSPASADAYSYIRYKL